MVLFWDALFIKPSRRFFPLGANRERPPAGHCFPVPNRGPRDDGLSRNCPLFSYPPKKTTKRTYQPNRPTKPNQPTNQPAKQPKRFHPCLPGGNSPSRSIARGHREIPRGPGALGSGDRRCRTAGVRGEVFPLAWWCNREINFFSMGGTGFGDSLKGIQVN